MSNQKLDQRHRGRNRPCRTDRRLAFADAGFGVSLVGPEANAQDGRTTALMNPALAMLDRLGVLKPLAHKAAPLKTIVSKSMRQAG